MGFGFDFGGAFQKATKAVDAVSKSAADFTSGVVETVTDVASGAATVVTEKASEAGDVISSSKVAEVAVGAAGAASAAVGDAAFQVAGKINDTAGQVAHTVDSGLKVIKERTPEAKARRARLAGFKDGIKQGIEIAGSRAYSFMYAYVATVCFFLRCDGFIDEEEEAWLRDGMQFIKMNDEIPDSVRLDLVSIASNENLDFDEVSHYLDDISFRSLENIASVVEAAIYADGVVTDEEEATRRIFANYIDKRTLAITPRKSIKSEDVINQAVAEYAGNLDMVTQEFKDKTRLQDADIAFLFDATMLQVMRVLIINTLTEVELAGKGNRNEEALHNMQKKVFNQFEAGDTSSSKLYASKGQIISTTSVPYDATNFEDNNIGFFTGANHRFATLGHDPILGLIFGTSNIMTNTITCTMKSKPFGVGLNIPITCNVLYDTMSKNPQISTPTSTIVMLGAASDRILSEPDVAAMAFLKQIIHIGTDLYTPKGIQLPMANIILDNKHAEKLTEYISTGDILKVGAQAGIAVLINWLIAALHGCSFIFKDDSSKFSTEFYQARTKKIILLSNTIATGSSVIQTAILKNPKCFDLGGAAVLVYRLFTDGDFIARLKEEYINSELACIYDEKANKYL